MKYLLPVVVAVFGLSSCTSDDPDIPGIPEDGYGYITLDFSNKESVAGKATRAAENPETRLNSLHCFFYTAGSEDDAAPVHYEVFEGLQKYQTATVNVKLTRKLGDSLFGVNAESGATCRMFVVANLPEGTSVSGAETVYQLKNLAVSSDFTKIPVSDFVMCGECDVTLTKDEAKGDKASGKADLIRAAAKITLSISLPEDGVVSEDVRWFPVGGDKDKSQIMALLTSGVKTSTVCPENVDPADADYFNVTTRDARHILYDLETGDYPYQMDAAFYTYPNSWTDNATEQHRTYMTLMVPWEKEDETELRYCYYQVPVTASDVMKLARNSHYHVNLKVNMLGSFVPGEPMEIDASYVTVDWGKVDTGVDINAYRFLVVNQNEFTLNNENSIEIPYYTSHDVEVESVRVTYQRFNLETGTAGNVYSIDITEKENEETKKKNDKKGVYSYELKTDASGNRYLVFNHDLKQWTACNSSGNDVFADKLASNRVQSAINSISYYKPTDEAAYSPYTIEIVIRHKDQTASTSFKQILVITQYPGMYIIADKNPGNGDNLGSWYNPVYSGNVYVNGVHDELGSVHGLTGNNKNPNMYIITISNLDSDSKYIIGDPRFNYVNNLNSNNNSSLAEGTLNGEEAAIVNSRDTWTNNWSNPVAYKTSNYLYDGGRPKVSGNSVLSYYYPTNETEEFKMMVAPKIRVASSYGVCTTGISRYNARRRCATYQEEGCPAGRWRLPTLGEMQFIVSLSTLGKIPTLFTNNANYYSAQGQVNIKEGDLSVSNSLSNMSVRCVYDEWYWAPLDEYKITPDANGKYEYTLGDMPKFNPNPNPNALPSLIRKRK